MRVRCIDNDGQPRLTFHKSYDVIGDTTHCYKIKDDSNDVDTYVKERFEILSEESEEPKSIVSFNPYDIINEFHKSMIEKGINVKSVNIRTDNLKISKDCETGVVMIEPIKNI